MPVTLDLVMVNHLIDLII